LYASEVVVTRVPVDAQAESIAHRTTASKPAWGIRFMISSPFLIDGFECARIELINRAS
jgi:hypothetical protein